MKKVGIMGGGFDPIHFGHLLIANEALNIYGFEKIFFIPSGNPPHKKGHRASCEDRYIMSCMATLTNESFTVLDIEIKNKAKSYTINTVKKLMEIYEDTEFYFITGTDAVIEITTWHKYEELMGLCKFIAVNRPMPDARESEGKLLSLIDKYPGRIEVLKVPMLQISSTDIRQRLSEKRSVKYLLPTTVEQYIIKNKLYMGQEND